MQGFGVSWFRAWGFGLGGVTTVRSAPVFVGVGLNSLRRLPATPTPG